MFFGIALGARNPKNMNEKSKSWMTLWIDNR
jgi:hypothetical protein